MKLTLTILAILLVLVLFIHWCIFGVVKYQTASGEHTGYVTAIEQTGLIFKTWTAYVKTNTTSSQEDTYCVIDPEVVSDLQNDAQNQVHVDLFYVSWFKAGMQNCDGESAIITKQVPLAN